MILRPVNPQSPCGPPNDKATRGVDVVLGACIEQVGGNYFLYDLFDHVFFDLLVPSLGSVLGREDHGPYPHGLAVFVLDADLRLGVRAQIGNFLVLAQPRQVLHQLVRESDGQRHELRGFAAGIAKHHALVASTFFLVQSFARVDALGYIGRLLVQGHHNRARAKVKALRGIAVANIGDDLSDEGFDV